MRRIDNYQVIEGEDTDTLETEVQAACNDGWEPFGSLAILHVPGSSLTFYQAVVSFDELEDDASPYRSAGASSEALYKTIAELRKACETKDLEIQRLAHLVERGVDPDVEAT